MVAELPRQIPPKNHNYVDREAVLAAMENLAVNGVENAVAVLKGLSGSGKTTTAGEVMHRFHKHYPDGQLFHRLSEGGLPVSTHDLLLNSLVALGDRREDLPDLLDALHGRYLTKTRGRRLLVVLDGAITAGQVRQLLPADGRSLTLVTITNAAADPDPGNPAWELGPLTDIAARELLTRIVGTGRFAAEPVAVDRILRLCDYQPFAICVVGGMLAQHPNRPIARLADLLDNDERRSERLALPGLFDAAYESLSEVAQECYRVLGLRSHVGRLHSAAVAAVLDRPEDEIDWAMLELADLSLVAEYGAGYQVPDLVRVHARRIGARAAAQQADHEQRLAAYYDRALAFADVLLAPARPWRELLYPDAVFPGPGVGEFDDADSARAWLRRELANIVAAAEHAFLAGRNGLVTRWCVLLWSFHEKDKHLESMRAMHINGIAEARRTHSAALESLLHIQLGFLDYWLRELPDAVTAFEHAVRTAETVSAPSARRQLGASALEGLGVALLAVGSRDESRAALRRNYELAEEIGARRRIALAALHLAKVEEPIRALELLAEADASLAQSVVDETENRAKISAWRGRALTELDRPEEAEPLLMRALTTMRDRHRRFDEAEILVALGECAHRRGNHSTAVTSYRAALDIYHELGFATAAATTIALIRVAESE